MLLTYIWQYSFKDMVTSSVILMTRNKAKNWHSFPWQWDWRRLVISRAAETGFGPSWKMPSSKGRPTTYLYIKSERMTLSCRVTWAGSERANLNSWQTMILPKKTKIYATLLSPGPLLDHQAPVICSGFPHVSSALVMRLQLQTLQEGDTQFTTCKKYKIQHQNMGFGMSALKFSMK